MPARQFLAVVALIVFGVASVSFAVRSAAAARDAKSDEPKSAVAAKADVPADKRFELQVKPILAEHCLACHGPDKAEGGLNLSDRKAALKQLESGLFGIVPGKPTESELLRRVSSHDEAERMPPEGKPLKPAEIETLRKWIAEGAAYQTHWAYRKLEKPTPPDVTHRSAVRNPIDAFILAKLEEAKIEPSPEAAREVQIKRLSFDLLGLLPTPEEVDAFVQDKSPRAYEALVDRLLASPHFGERWGRHWLDMARYADSDGYEKDRARPDAYLFRDWVINAFNDDKPFDQFTIEQLAGDLLPNATVSQKLATAFNRQTLTNEEGGVDQEEYRVNAVFDRTDTLGAVWLGLTLGCAKCHNHKYDEISQAEYYQMFAFFNEADEVLTRMPVKATDADALEAKLQPLEAALEARRRELAPLQAKWEEEQRDLIESKPNTKLEVVDFTSPTLAATSGLAFTREKDGTFAAVVKQKAAAAPKLPATDTYTVTIDAPPADLTGFRLDVLPHPELPKKFVGLSGGGNFVLSRFAVRVVDASGKVMREVPLQRATASFEQQGFKAIDALTPSANAKKGWAVKPKYDAAQNFQVRTKQPLKLAPGERLQIVLDQNYGGGHTMARLKLRGLTGDARELHLPPDVVTALKMYPEKRIALTRATLFNFYAGQAPQVAKLQEQIEATLREYKAQMMPVRTIGTSLKPRKTYRFDRGDFLSKAEEVRPSMLHVLPPLSQGGAYSRVELARWLVGRDNPLTPRVVANQFWARLFGAGIVRSVGDFGSRGELPSHPELLDWLAATFQRDLRWSMKGLIKTIVMSGTYRQASTHRPELVEVDPLNTLLSRQNRLRVEGEVVRDLALGAAGLLSKKVGGPSVFPPMPSDLAKLSYANNFSWTDSTGEDRYRRGMYTFFKRTIPHPTLMTFDCPDANVTCVNRTVSNTPLQALTLLNNDAFVEASQAMAARLLADDDKSADAKTNDATRLAKAVKICLARAPHAGELDQLDNLLDKARQYYKYNPEEAERMIGRFAKPAIAAAEAAAWTATVRVLLNLDEFITRE